MMKVVSVTSSPATDFTTGNAEPNLNDTDEEINARMRVLFAKQWEIFEFFYIKARDQKKSYLSRVKKEIELFHIFLAGGAGCGKSNLSKSICQSLIHWIGEVE